MSKPGVMASVIIVTMNSAKYIRRCLSEVFSQTCFDATEVIVVDNNSFDQTTDIIKNEFPKVKLIKKDKNVGFSEGNNIGICLSKGKYIFCINADIVLDNSFIETACRFLETRDEVGALSGKVLKYDFDKDEKIKCFDTTGLVISKSRRVCDRGQGEDDTGQYDRPEEVFGVCAAAGVYRRSALDSVKLMGEYFDTSFFVYKEDIDLSWRLRLAGWNIVYYPGCKAYHKRSTGVISDKSGAWQIMKNRSRNVSALTKKLSYRNQRLMQIKNEIPSLVAKDFPHMLLKELSILAYILLLEPRLLSSVKELLVMAPLAYRKRKLVMKTRKVRANDMGRWFA